MESEKYKLINPVISGKFNKEFISESKIDAGHQFWKRLTVDESLVTKNLQQFMFSLENIKTKEQTHYKVKEKGVDKMNTNYTIKMFSNEDLKLSPEELKKFNKKYNSVEKKMAINQEGGKVKHLRRSRKHRKHSTSSSSDSDSSLGSSSSSSSDSSSSSSSDSDEDDYINNLKRKAMKKKIYHWWYAPNIYRKIVRNLYTPSISFPNDPPMQLWIPSN
jgi:hypothetical protein